MKTLVLIVVAVIAVGALLTAAHLGRRWSEQRRPHDPVEYYASWAGYQTPIRLVRRLTKAQADAQAARGYAYMIGHFDTGNRLVRAVKMLQGKVFFDQQYTYDANGRLMRIRNTNADGIVSDVEYHDNRRWWSLW